MSSFTEEDIEIGKLFDSLRQLQVIKESFVGKENKETVEVEGKKVDAEKLADALLAVDLQRFRELVDMNNPFYADFVSELEHSSPAVRLHRHCDQPRPVRLVPRFAFGYLIRCKSCSRPVSNEDFFRLPKTVLVERWSASITLFFLVMCDPELERCRHRRLLSISA